jgi:hypothetical protein
MRALSRDARAVTAVEFAMIAPVLVLLTLGTIDVGYTLTVKRLLEASAREASRFGITGSVPADRTREAQIRAIVERTLIAPEAGERLAIAVRAYKSFDNVGQPEPFDDTNANGVRDAGEAYTDVNGNGRWDSDMGVPAAGGSGDVVVYTLTYPQPVLVPFMERIYGADTITHRARAVVRNEPF